MYARGGVIGVLVQFIDDMCGREVWCEEYSRRDQRVNKDYGGIGGEANILRRNELSKRFLLMVCYSGGNDGCGNYNR